MSKLLHSTLFVSLLCLGGAITATAQKYSTNPVNNQNSKSAYYINASINPTLGGTVQGAGTYNAGDSVYLKAIPNTGYTFTSWTENGNEISNQPILGIKVTSDKYYMANFKGMFDNPIEQSISNKYYGQTISGDYDNDGDMDILRIGANSPATRALIYRNDGNSTFTELSDLMLLGLQGGVVNWIDFDNDNDLDALIVGNISGQNEWKTMLYRNDGNDIFTDISESLIPNFKIYFDEVGDFNNDGWDDFFAIGMNGNIAETKIFLNNKNNSFSALDLKGIGVSMNVQCKFADYDNDGDLDLLTGEISGGHFVTKLFKNNSGIGFEDNPIIITNEYCGTFYWGDYDADGDLDILLSGYEDVNMTATVRIYRNDGADTFTKVTVEDNLDYNNYPCEWADFNNDGLLDIVAKLSDILKVYLNNGNDTFSSYNSPLYFNTININNFDQDNDGDQDIVLIGLTFMGEGQLRIYDNNTILKNTKPHAPQNLSSSIQPNQVVLKWDKATDTETPADGLSYNLWIKKEGDANYTLSPKAITGPGSLNGSILMPQIGRIRLTTQGYSPKDLPIGTYKWSVQSIDASFAGSNFSPEQTFTIESLLPTATTDSATLISATKVMLYGKAFAGNLETTVNFEYTLTPEINTSWIAVQTSSTITGTNNYPVSVSIDSLEYNSTYTYRLKATNSLGTAFGQNLSFSTPSLFVSKSTSLPILNPGTSVWGDYDNDGFIDVLVFGIDANANVLVTKLYHNNKDATFSENENTGFIKICSGNASWGDFDNDGDLDLVISGDTSHYSGKPAIELYKNKGMGTFEKVNGNKFTPVCWLSDLKWNDCNNDGKLDLLVTGSELYNQPSTKLYMNKGNGIFEENLDSGMPIVWNSSCDWADFNNDGWADMLIQGISNAKYEQHILKNNKNSSFSDIKNSPFQGLNNGNVICADLDADGKLDYLSSGQSTINDYLPEVNIFLNVGNDSFIKKVNSGIEQINIYSANFGDLDVDGQSDLLFAGDNQGYKILFYKNTGEGSFADFGSKSNLLEKLYYVNIVDVDSDGDLDFMGFGYDEHYTHLTNLYLNQIEILNNAPEAPTNLKTSQFWAQNTLTWNQASDTETASKVLTYNVRIGTTSGGRDIVSPHNNNNGRLTIPAMGNAQTDTTFIVDSLPAGVYYWSVQAVDASFVGGEFSEENTFFVYPSAPISEDANACYGSLIPELVAIGENIKWYADRALTNLIHSGNTFTPDSTQPGTYTFYVNQTVSGSVSLADTVYLTIFNKPDVIISDSTNISCFGYANGTATALASGAIEPYSYLWNDVNGTAQAMVTGLSPNFQYQVIASDLNGCSDTAQVTLSEPEPLSLQSEFSDTICKDGQNGYINISVLGGTPDYNYNWSNGAVTEDLVGVAVGNYQVDITDDNQCLLTSNFTIAGTTPYNDQEICLVSVVNNKNQIIWEKTSDPAIASYSIYRESNTVGSYDPIGVVPSNELSVFVDENSNPNQRAYQYKISIIDTCGNESDLSNYHRTMHLQVSMGINSFNLNWDNYEYEGGGFTFDYFDIYRGSSPENMEVIGNIGSNYHSTTDENPPAGMLYYQIAGIKADACQPTTGSQKTGENYGISFSNVENNGFDAINEYGQDLIKVFPNPFENSLSIESNQLLIRQISITNLIGQSVYSNELNNNSTKISTEGFVKGSYLITLLLENGSYSYQLIMKE